MYSELHASTEDIDEGFPLQIFREALFREVVPGARLSPGTERILSITQLSGVVIGGTEVPPRVKACDAVGGGGVFTLWISELGV